MIWRDRLAAYSAAARVAATPWRARWGVRAVAVAAAGCLLTVGAFVAGKHYHQQGMTILTGVASAGTDRASGASAASVTVNGWTYGLRGPGDIPWVDSQGQTHQGGWPACLAGTKITARIRFGEVPVTLPDGTLLRQIVWVDCQP
jgi:hypothetical protein